jgi:hypothetical protein
MLQLRLPPPLPPPLPLLLLLLLLLAVCVNKGNTSGVGGACEDVADAVADVSRRW